MYFIFQLCRPKIGCLVLLSLEENKPIRSYVLRSGRITAAQKRAIEKYWPKWGLDPSSDSLNPQIMFGRNSKIILEIGFGMGESIIQSAIQMPNVNFIGVEVHAAGIGKILNEIANRDLKNVRIFWHDAVEIVEKCLPFESISAVNIFFPDPWHKKKHNKRRLIKAEFVNSINKILCKGGRVHLSTDCSNYAEQMMEVMSASQNWRNPYGANKFANADHGRPETKFELRGRRLGNKIWDLVFIQSP